MSITTVVDAVAAKAAGLVGIKDAYGAGVAGSGVTPMVSDPFTDTPVALVLASTGSLDTGNGRQLAAHNIVIELWLSTANATDDRAYRDGVTFIETFRVAWLTGNSLGGVCQMSYLTGYGPFRDEAVDENRPFLVVPLYLTAIEQFNVTPTA